MKTEHSVKTRLAAGGTQFETDLTLDWEGMPQAEIIALAAKTVVIQMQSIWRDAGKVPGAEVQRVMDLKNRPRATVITPEKIGAVAAKMTPEERAALIAKLTAME